jgi:putative hemolysin
MMRAIEALAFAGSLLLLGCPSKDSATSPSSSGGAGVATGPLANLEAAPFANEVWIAQEGGQQMPFIYYTQQNVRLSAGCRSAAGQLNCAAINQLRSGNPVEVPKRMLTGGVSAGTRACIKMGNKLFYAHTANGTEDGFCVFPDGSMVSTGALEQYGMRVGD